VILPTKHILPERALISVASEVFSLIEKRATVSSIWNELKDKHREMMRYGEVPFDWFILSLDLLFVIGAIEEKNGIIKKVKSNAK